MASHHCSEVPHWEPLTRGNQQRNYRHFLGTLASIPTCTLDTQFYAPPTPETVTWGTESLNYTGFFNRESQRL